MQNSFGVANNSSRFEDIILNIKKHGYSITPQRLEIIRIVAESKNHPSANEIYDKVRKIYPMISLNTVYKNLSMLSELHQVKEIKTLQDAVRFDGDISPHGHIICENCGKINDFETHDIDTTILDCFLKLDIVKKTGDKGNGNFGKISGYNIEFHGICNDCFRQ